MSCGRSGLFTLANAKIVRYALADSREPAKPWGWNTRLVLG